jgi:hypothetical protein
MQELIRRAQETPGFRLTVDLEEQAVYDDRFRPGGVCVDPFVRRRLLEVWTISDDAAGGCGDRGVRGSR